MNRYFQDGPFDAAVIGVFEEDIKSFPHTEILSAYFGGNTGKLLEEGIISSELNRVSVVLNHTFEDVKKFYFVGLGSAHTYSMKKMKEAFATGIQNIKGDGAKTISIYLDSFCTENSNPYLVSKNLGEAFERATYVFHGYKTEKPAKQFIPNQLSLLTHLNDQEIVSAFHEGRIFGHGQNSARTLTNTPPNILTTNGLVAYCEELCEKYGLELSVLDRDECEALGMGAFLAVNQGSSEPARMIVIKYQGKSAWENVVGLVGKGVMYDTGGYSIKPKDGMAGMKTDMGGAAAVLGALEIIGEIRPNTNVVAVIPATDNSINEFAMRPDDVVVSMSGKTIEITNTDAEGRLTLCDGITYVKQLGANVVIDVATLTGGVITALGVLTTGAMTNNQELFHQIQEIAAESDERLWQLPIFEEDKKKVRNSPIADLNNSPSREGHAIMGGAFLEAFAEGTPWVHLDIAGTSVTSKGTSLNPVGATGVMARTLASFIISKQD